MRAPKRKEAQTERTRWATEMKTRRPEWQLRPLYENISWTDRLRRQVAA